MAATLALGMWNALGSLFSGAAIFAVFYVAGFLAWRRDPAMLFIIAAGQSSRSRYDPGKPTKALVEIVG